MVVLKKSVLLSGVVVLLFLIVLSFQLNRFKVYENVQDFFDDNYSYKVSVEAVIYGDDSCLVYYKTGIDSYSYCYFRTLPNGYKLLKNSSYKKVFDKFDSEGSIEVYHLNETDDYYLMAVADPNAKDICLYSDNDNEIKLDVTQIKNTNFYCAFIDDFPENACFAIG